MLNKASLMRAVTKSTGLSCHDASVCVDVIIEAISVSISRGDRIELRGLGSFTVKKTAPKKLNFANASNVVPAHGKIVFRPCQKLRESVWNRVSG